MKSSLILTAIVACVFALAGNLQAQETSNGGMVAVLDVAKVFEANALFNQRMDAIKAEAEQFKAQMEAEQQRLQQMAEQGKDYKPGSPELKQLEADVEAQAAQMRTKARQTNTDMLNREARIYYDTYTQMQQVVGGMSDQFGISLVIRFDSKSIDPENRGEVIQGVNRNVVYQKNLDLTTMVIEKMAAESTADNRNLNN
ncbi:MAG: OmpH family outer membrane protein [Pirellulaceae bacterium]